jgi:hypothetical protein
MGQKWYAYQGAPTLGDRLAIRSLVGCTPLSGTAFGSMPSDLPAWNFIALFDAPHTSQNTTDKTTAGVRAG